MPEPEIKVLNPLDNLFLVFMSVVRKDEGKPSLEATRITISNDPDRELGAFITDIKRVEGLATPIHLADRVVITATPLTQVARQLKAALSPEALENFRLAMAYEDR